MSNENTSQLNSQEQELYTNSVIQALTNQRNASQNECVTLSSQLNVANARIKQLQDYAVALNDRLAEVTPAAPAPEADFGVEGAVTPN
jgi:hypothetical protein